MIQSLVPRNKMSQLLKVKRINEGISHLEDLKIDDFIDKVRKLPNMTGSEKMDGAELVFGLDDDGKFYTTRSFKSGTDDKIYSTKDWYKTGGGPTFAAAHSALSKALPTIEKVMKPGEAVEVEVLFGRQPNAVVYGANGKNYIVFLRGIEGRKDLPKLLGKALTNKGVTVDTDSSYSDDGVTVKQRSTPMLWDFGLAKEIEGKRNEEAEKQLDSLQKFLDEENEVAKENGIDASNFDILRINLSKVAKEKRKAISDERARLEGLVLADYKLPIKRSLLKSYRDSFDPSYRDSLNDDDYDGIEGIVFTDPESGDLIKLVDKEEFTSLNKFNHFIRKKLSGVAKTVDKDAPLEDRGGIAGIMKWRIFNLLGIPETARSGGVKRLVKAVGGTNLDDSISKIAQGMQSLHHNPIRHKISAIIGATIDELDETLRDFKANSGTYKFKLGDGKEVGYSKDVIDRTLLSFAELRTNLENMKRDVNKSHNMESLLRVLFGDKLETLFEDTVMVKPDNPLKKLKQKSAEEIASIYGLNYLAALCILRISPKDGLRLLKDDRGGKLQSFKRCKSYMNKLGYLVFKPKNPDVANLTMKKEAERLNHMAGRILSSRRKEIHSGISNPRMLDWLDIDNNIRIISLRLALHDVVYGLATEVLYKWETSDADDKIALLNRLYLKLTVADGGSDYLNPLRICIDKYMSSLHGEVARKGKDGTLLKDIVKLNEDDGGDGGAIAAGAETSPASGTLAGSTSSGDIAASPFRLLKGKIIRRIPRKYKKRAKFSKEKGLVS